MGNNDNFEWGWCTWISNPNDYINNNGELLVKVYAEGDDYTVLQNLGVRYTPPDPDLDCNGNLVWNDVNAGQEITGSFTVENIGPMGTELDWEVVSWPDWGENWYFYPDSGNNLKPEDGPFTVGLMTYAPDQAGQTFTGEIVVCNEHNEADWDTVPVSITTIEGDTTPPETYIDSGPSGTINYNDVTFTWHGEDDITPTEDLVYSYMLEGYSSWSSFVSQTSKDYYDLSDGTYTFKVKAKDLAGNIDPTPAEQEFTVSTSSTPVPNLECSGNLNWNDVTPGDTVTGSFTVSNCGDTGSELDWAITDYPSWGTWTFNPNSGTGLLAGYSTTVQVQVVAPNQYGQTYDGVVKATNLDDTNDWDTVPATLTTISDNGNIPPTVEITEPKEGDTVRGDVYIYGTASDPDGEVIDVWIGIDEDPGFSTWWGGSSWSYTWDTWGYDPGSYTINVKALDDDYDFSEIVSVNVNLIENQGPNTPVIEGCTNGYIDTPYEYTFAATDPEGDDIYKYEIMIDGGDGEPYDSGMIYGPFKSGEKIKTNITWRYKGESKIQVCSWDIYGAWGKYGSLEVTMPRSRSLLYMLFERLIDRFPLFERLLNLIH